MTQHLLHLTAFALLLALPATARTTWDRQFYDLGAARSQGAEPDLVLPMPCGGAMAFQRVTVSVSGQGPLADKQIRLGQSGTATAYVDYLRQDYLRGGFWDGESLATHYYIARYELSEMQYAALTQADCGFKPSVRMTVPQLGLSWYEATDLGRRYTEWLRSDAPDALPKADGQMAYLRLPTETEWEFAARGGEAVDALDFSAQRPPMTEAVNFYAQFDQQGPGPSGARAPNPLSLFDMLGNAEELTLEPFRLNAVGHVHGQAGGVVTRGGSFMSSEADMRSARRSEWPPFNASSGKAQAQPTFGMRLVLSVQALTDDARVAKIDSAWTSGFEGGADQRATPLPVNALASMIETELDPARRNALEGMQLTLSMAQDAAARAEGDQTAATLQMASAILLTIQRQHERIQGMSQYLEKAQLDLENTTGETPGFDADLLAQYRADLEATIADFGARIPEMQAFQRDMLGSYREALTQLTQPGRDIAPAIAAYASRLQTQENASMGVTLDLLSADIAAYRKGGITDAEALLELALD